MIPDQELLTTYETVTKKYDHQNTKKLEFPLFFPCPEPRWHSGPGGLQLFDLSISMCSLTKAHVNYGSFKNSF